MMVDETGGDPDDHITDGEKAIVDALLNLNRISVTHDKLQWELRLRIGEIYAKWIGGDLGSEKLLIALARAVREAQRMIDFQTLFFIHGDGPFRLPPPAR